MKNQKPQVLIVDDEKGLRVGAQRLLEDEGYEVDTAENGTKGIELGTKNEYDLAVIDLKMPDVEGLEVLKKIKSGKPNTVCFIATAYASYDTAIDATRLGAFGYIPKPFTPEELISQLEKGFKQRLLILESEKLKREQEENLLELAYEKSRLNTVIHSIKEGILVVNKIGEVVYFNSAALKNLNLNELNIGEYVLDKLPEKISFLLNKYLTSDTNIDKSYSEQIEILPQNKFFAEAITSPILNADGSFAGIVIVIRDITELKKIDLIKSQFVSMVAHELKTPMAAVMGYLNLILDPDISVPHEKQEGFLYRSVERLNSSLQLVNDLLDISRLELKSTSREISSININDAVKNALETLELEIKKKGIEVKFEFEEDLPELKADALEITRIITNILSNAIKYNIFRGKIFIRTKCVKHYLQIEIRDTGIGMTSDERKKLFQEFFRAKNEKTRGIGGTGLGLSIVKRIVDSYAGKIDVKSLYGQGTTFIISLPINK